jgi:S-adenosylmethionine hydrolase
VSERPVIAILTDFGSADPYVGAMKGAILSACREAVLVDLGHDVPPHDCLAGALHLAAAVPYFPGGTTFLAVVDPGVGSARRAIAAEAGGFTFVGPDNGLLSVVLDRLAPARVVSLENPRYCRPSLSRTFEGRDRLGPAAAWLAAGTPLDELGPRVDGYVRLVIPAPEVAPGRVSGETVTVDRFGNVVTNIGRADLARAAGQGAAVAVIDGRDFGPLVGTYADVEPGAACALVGSADYLELAVREGRAADRCGSARGTPVRVVWR